MANDHAEDADVALMTGDTPVEWMATATDPEGGDITWSLSGADEDMFELTGTGNASGSMRGLAFKAKPDFEAPGDANGDNIYEVTVVASDGDNTGMRPVTVKVINVIETGKVELTVTDPVVGKEIKASLADSDGVVIESVEWAWETATDRAFGGGHAVTVIKGAESSSYTPTATDAGKYLRAKATYLDRTDRSAADNLGDETETAMPLPSPEPMGFKNVKWSVVTTAVLDDPANQAPVFNEGSATVRYVRENEDVLENIGPALTAKDGDGDVPAYTKGGADEDSFDIISTTGQLITKAGVDLDYETKKIYTVIVTANDNTELPNDTASIRVTIKVIDEDEKPDIWDTANTARTTEHSVLSFKENSNDAVIDLDSRDPEGVTPIGWSVLENIGNPAIEVGGTALTEADIADGVDFSISSSGVLTFAKSPNFEMPRDSAMGQR